MRTKAALIALALVAAGACGPSSATEDVPSSKPSANKAPGFREAKWEELVPADWDPMKSFRPSGVGAMGDNNPRALQMMREMRAAWDNAPTNSKMEGAAVKLPGYLVPLDEVNGQISEFLLVPYFGACIHVPPPPANQIVHVIVDKPTKGFRSMDAVWVSGTLKTARLDSTMGASGYQMRAVLVDHYVRP